MDGRVTDDFYFFIILFLSTVYIYCQCIKNCGQIKCKCMDGWASQVAQQKESACQAGDVSLIPGSEDLEKEMATHSSIPAWEIPRTEEAGGLQSKESWRVGHNLATKQQQRHILMGNYTLFTSLVCHIHWEKLRKLKCTCFKLHRDQ